MRRQSLACISTGSGIGEPLIVVEESTIGEEDADRRRNESPPRCLDPDSPSLNPYLLSPWRETRKHSLPTPQCTSGITASQVRRLSERGGEGSGPSPKEAAFLATLSQGPARQPGGRRHSVVTISKIPATLFGRNRRESIAAFPLAGSTRILPARRDTTAGLSGPPSNSGSTHNLQLDIMDDIAEIKARKVRLKMYQTPSRERVCEIQPLEGNSSAQRYTQYQKRRFSEASAAPAIAGPSSAPSRRRASEMPRLPGSISPAAGIVCSNTDLISILSSLASSATEINRCGEEPTAGAATQDDAGSTWAGKSVEQKRNRLKSFRSNSFDVSILNAIGGARQTGSVKVTAGASVTAPSSWFAKRHQPMWKKQRADAVPLTGLGFKFDKSKVVKVVKDTLAGTSPTKDAEARHKVVWDGTSGTKVDAQVFGSAIEKILTAQKGSDSETASTSSGKPAVSPNKPRPGKVASWFAGSGNKEQEQSESCESSICSSLKDLFVK